MADTMHGGLSCDEVRDLAPGFVLGALAPDDMHHVRDHLASCPEPHPEMVELGSVLPALARSVETAHPSADLGVRILAAARAEQATMPVPVAAPEPAPAPAATPARPAAGRGDRRIGRSVLGFLDVFRAPRLAAAGLVVVLVIAVLGAWTMELSAQVAGLSAYRDGVTAVLDAASAPGAQVAVLRAPVAQTFMLASTGLAAVDPSGKLVIAMRDLPPTSGSQVYEAWLIGSDGKPVPAGSFAVDDRGVGTLDGTVGSKEAGVVVALTLEPGPGATAPTTPVIIEGKASAPSS